MMEKVINTSPCLLQAGQPLKTGGAVPVRNKKNTGTFNNDDWKKKRFQPTKYKWLGSTHFFLIPYTQ